MELIDRVRRALARDYGINSEEELMAAVGKQKALDIGIFVSPCGMKVETVAENAAAEI